MSETETILTNSVILPVEDFRELSEVAWNQPPATGKERVESVLQTTAIVAACAAAFSAASWGWAKAVNWRDKKSHERKLAEAKFEIDHDIKLDK